MGEKLYINCGSGNFSYPKTGDVPTPYLNNAPATADVQGWDNTKAIQRFNVHGTADNNGYTYDSLFSEGTLAVGSGTSLQAAGYTFTG